MRIRIIRTFLALAAFSALFTVPILSQVVVERSKDKVIISGVQYYMHTVRKGETAYSIARAYNVTVEELVKENPPAVYGIRDGQSLKIPVRPETLKPETTVRQPELKRDDSRYIYHKLSQGETIYSLSRAYGVTEKEIVDSNTGIDITKLPVGAEIAVPRRSVAEVKQKAETQVTAQPPQRQQANQPPTVQETRQYMHKVEMGETFSSIADRYGLTIRELRRANRDTRFPQVGGYLKIPGKLEIVTPAPVIEEIKEEVAEEIPGPVSVRPTVITEVKKLEGTFNLAVLLPFYLGENSQRSEYDPSDKSRNRKKVIFRNDDWIYPRSIDFIEMYDGILLAADSLRSLGIDINIHTWDIRSDSAVLVNLINSGRLANMDLIIGPVYSANLTRLASWAKNMGIPVVSPVPLFSDSPLSGNPTLFLTNPALSLSLAQAKLAKALGQYSGDNIIMIHSDTLGTDESRQRFRNLIYSELGSRLPESEIKFREMLFYSRARFGNDSINRLGNAMSDKAKNIVIIASEESPVISETMEAIHTLSRKFDITAVGYPVMKDIENLDPRYFFDLNALLCYPLWIDYRKDNVKRFLADYRKKFLTEPLETSYAWHGYDLAYYFISGISMHGKEFIDNPFVHNPDLLANRFWFVRNGEGNGLNNENLFLIRYSKDYEISLEADQDISSPGRQ